MRLFYGIPIPDDVKAVLSGFQRDLKGRGLYAGNWSKPELLHVTVVFLGELSASSAKEHALRGTHAVQSQASFELTLDHAEAFERNRILWIGFEEDDGYRDLQRLQERTVASLQGLPSFNPEGRPFRPHVTLARKLDLPSWHRVSQSSDWPEKTIQSSIQGIKIPVRELFLFQSTRVKGQLAYPVHTRYPFPLR